MLTDFNSLRAGGQGNCHHSIRLNRQPRHRELRLGGDKTAEQWHQATEAGVAEPAAEGLAYGFFGRPEVQERFDFVGLFVHPGQLERVEPAVGQAGDVDRAPLFQVDTDRAVGAGRDGHEVVTVADAHPQRIHMWPAEVVVPQYRLLLQKRPGEGEQKSVCGRSLIVFGRCQPDVRGCQIGARTLNHRKKVSR